MKIEISHDSLAKSIFDRVSHDDKQLLKIARFVHERHVYYKESETLLDKKDLEYIAPYTDKLDLSTAETLFIAASKQLVKTKRRNLIIWLIVVNAGLGALIAYMFYTNRQEVRLTGALEDTQKSLATTEKKLASTKKRAIAILDKRNKIIEETKDSLANNTVGIDSTPTDSINVSLEAYAKHLIRTYKTLKTENKKIKEEKNIAQSTTLSYLALEALQQQKDNYAFQLAAHSWKLNNDNKQACDILYDIKRNTKDGYDAKRDTSIHEIIESERLKRGDLNQNDIKAIFSQQNEVAYEKGDNIEETVQNVIKEIDIEQSTILSNLALEALQRKEENYAFQLAAYSWKLNNENEQASKVLNDIYNQSSSKPLPIQTIINTEKIKRGELSADEIELILAPEYQLSSDPQDNIGSFIPTEDEQ